MISCHLTDSDPCHNKVHRVSVGIIIWMMYVYSFQSTTNADTAVGNTICLSVCHSSILHYRHHALWRVGFAPLGKAYFSANVYSIFALPESLTVRWVDIRLLSRPYIIIFKHVQIITINWIHFASNYHLIDSSVYHRSSSCSICENTFFTLERIEKAAATVPDWSDNTACRRNYGYKVISFTLVRVTIVGGYTHSFATWMCISHDCVMPSVGFWILVDCVQGVLLMFEHVFVCTISRGSRLTKTSLKLSQNSTVDSFSEWQHMQEGVWSEHSWPSTSIHTRTYII